MRVLFLTHRVPYAPNRGDRIRAFQILRHLKTLGIPVCLVALAHDQDEVTQASSLSAMVDALHVVRVTRSMNLVKGALRLGTNQPLTHLLLDSPQMRPLLEDVCKTWRPDLVLAYCSGMARYAMEPPLATLPFVLDMVDVDSFKWEALAGAGWGPRAWIYRREARVLRRFEADATRAARATLVVSPREAEALRSLDGRFEPVILPNGVDLDSFRNTGQAAGRLEVVFTGVFSYEPNETAALWLLKHVWPLVQAALPEAHLTLVGIGPSQTLRRRAAQAGVEVTGSVPDVRPYLWRATVAVAPLETARGVQNKVLEAVAAGLPAVVTPAVFEGLPDAVRPACRVARGAQTFADQVRELLCLSKARRHAVAGSASLEALAWENVLAPLGKVLAGATG